MLSSVSVEVSTEVLVALELEDSIPGRGMDPSKGSGQGPFHGEGSVPAKGPFPNPSEGSVPGKGSVALEGSVPGSSSGKGPLHIGGSVPAKGPVALESSVLGQGKQGHGTISAPRVTGVPADQEFPIMTHFRFRRLLAFLACTCSSAFQALQRDVAVFLDLTYLQRLVANCMWDDAEKYLLRVIPYEHMGVEGHALVDFLVNLRFMHTIAHGHPIASQLIAMFEQRCREPAIDNGEYANVMHTILSMRSEQVRQSVDWHLVGLKAAEIIRDMITQTPEFSHYLRLPRLPSDLHDVINVFPHGFRSRRICRVKKAGRVPGSVIAKHFLPKQRFQDAGQGKNRLELLTDPPAWLRASIDEALKAGTRTVLH
ncbi:unnamed protein product [Urochloa decumbens]|uniref:Uncharacterized protein n=2 Tax=Urochloa decumbens TaxID=240449 RepID=A0ABC9CNF9_9POAL